jgi:chromosome segregation ATPase
MLGRKKKKDNAPTWEYIKRRYPDVVEELRSLKDWEDVRASIVEAEKMDDYSLVALHAVAAITRQERIDVEMLSERIEVLLSKLEGLRSDNDNAIKSLSKEVESLKNEFEDIRKRTLFLQNLEQMLPKINEIDEKINRFEVEVRTKIENRLESKIDEKIGDIVEARMKELEERLTSGIFGASVELARAFEGIQGRYESLLHENITLKEELKAKEKEIKELNARISLLQESLKKVDELSKKVSTYEASLRELAIIKERLAKITGRYDVNEALAVLEDFVPKAKFEMLAKELKAKLAEIDSLIQENNKLRAENEKLRAALKDLLERMEDETGEG